MSDVVELRSGEQISVEDAWSKVFATSVSGSGEEELLRLASKFSLQLSTAQMRVLLYLSLRAIDLEDQGRDSDARKLKHFLEAWREWKQYNHSDVYVMRALDSISLRRLINENTLKVSLDRK